MKPLKRISAPRLPEELQWRTVKVPAGLHRPYMVAGVGWEGTTHAVPNGTRTRTVACAAALTDGEVACEFCKYAPRYSCYLPLYALAQSKQKKLVVQGAKRTWATWQSFRFGDFVCINRGKAERDTILFSMTKGDDARVNVTALKEPGPQDIDAYLLHLWQIKELCEWHGTEWHPSAKSIDGDRSLWLLREGGAHPISE